MSYNNDCSCDAIKFYEKYKDRIELILSQNFIDEDNVITPSEDSLEEEYYERDKDDSTSPQGILTSGLSRPRRKSVTFTDAVSYLEKVIDEDKTKLDEEYDTKGLKEDENANVIDADKTNLDEERKKMKNANVIDEDKTNLDEEYDTKSLKEDKNAKVIDEDKTKLDAEYDTKGLKEDANAKVINGDKTKLNKKFDTKGLKENKKAKKIIITDKDINDIGSLPTRKSKLIVKRKSMEKDRSIIQSGPSLKLTDHDLQKHSFKQSLALLKKHTGPKLKQYEIDAKLKYLTSQGNMAEGEWQGEKDMYYHERILEEVKKRMAKYHLYESTSLDEGEDRYSIKFEPKTEEWYSESQRRAEMYLKNHRILELFHFLGSHLTVSNTENPIEFLINLLDNCLKYRDGNDEPPLFFTSKYIKSLFETMDRMNTGVISLKQYRNGMLTLGIKDYEKYPKTDANYMVDETTFVTEALVSLKAHLNGLIKAVPTPTVSLLWPSEIDSRTSLMSA